MKRHCSRSGCNELAVATLTFVYADQMAVLGPLALEAQPGTYDLCAWHAEKTSAPKGWQVVKLTDPDLPEPEPDSDDLERLANLIRKIGLRDEPTSGEAEHDSDLSNVVELRRRGHLRVIADAGIQPDEPNPLQ